MKDNNVEPFYTKEQLAKYVEGWLTAGKDGIDDNNPRRIGEFSAALKNAANMLCDENDGLEAQIRRDEHKHIMSEDSSDREFLQWIYERMVNVHGEKTNLDYMLKLAKYIHKLKSKNEPLYLEKLRKGDVIRAGDFYDSQWGLMRFDKTPKDGFFRKPRKYNPRIHSNVYRVADIRVPLKECYIFNKGDS